MKMNHVIASIAKPSIILFLASFVFADPPGNLSGWNLVFEDNFDGTSLDKKKWNPTYNWGPTHNHRAYCAEENVIVSDGTLKLKGEKKKHPKATGDRSKAKFNNKEIPVDYTSGAIDTKGHFEVKYGYIEGRFKAPWQKGTWPAFWTLQDGWPPEIDIVGTTVMARLGITKPLLAVIRTITRIVPPASTRMRWNGTNRLSVFTLMTKSSLAITVRLKSGNFLHSTSS